MIIICPECSTRYVVADASIGEEGRTVKCANCAHQWFQGAPEQKGFHKYRDEMPDLDFDLDTPAPAPEPEDEPEVEIAPPEEEFDAIPESVKPLPEDEPREERPAKPLPDWTGAVSGYAAAAVVLLGVIGLLGLMKDTVVSAWPPSAIIYETFGADVKYSGEGLIFDRVTAKTDIVDGKDILTLSGVIINLKSEPVALPSILASLQTEGNEQAASWIIDPQQDTIAAEESIPFSMEYELGSRDVTNASVMFLARAPKAEAPAGEYHEEEHQEEAAHEEKAQDDHAEEAAHGEDSHDDGGHH